jgi:starch synthase (maltosyl-transferring)
MPGRRPEAASIARTGAPPRAVIERVRPEVDGGRFPAKRIAGDLVAVEASVFADGHDAVACVLLYRAESDAPWTRVPMTPLGNDRWQAGFGVPSIGRYVYTIEAWVDPVLTWQRDLALRIGAGQDVGVELLIGAGLADEAAARAEAQDADRLRAWAATLRDDRDAGRRHACALDVDLGRVASHYRDPDTVTRYDRDLTIVVDRERARFSAWYEVFPRSCADTPGRHGTLADCARWLPDIAAMGFDIVYLPPIHPIGRTFRKGKNNAPVADPEDVGSPWAIGSSEGGHMAVHPALGTLDDLRDFVGRAGALGLEVALDLAYQCSPDHPYVREHPQWFRKRPDGTIQYAENPPKKYQDIYPFDFESADWRALWEELRRVIVFWIEQGVRIFRVDNPHTKALAFWAWAIADLKTRYPDLIFLAEAFTRPGPMYRLAKLGFTQSYTYFTWRNTAPQLTEYFRELTGTDVREFFRPNLWPNTPDILHEYLQAGGPPAFRVRAVLAATLGANYGVYGPAFELCENQPREKGSEEYLHSEKYEIRHRRFDTPVNLRPLLTTLNRIRREHRALQSDHSLLFHPTDNPMLLAYSKTAAGTPDVIVTIVNLDPVNRQSGWVTLDLSRLGVPGDAFDVQDLLTGARYVWRAAPNYVELTPAGAPAHILCIGGGPA